MTQSAIRKYEECKEQFALAFIDGLSTKTMKAGLEFGSISHYCIEHQYNYNSPEDCAGVICEEYFAHRGPQLANSYERDNLRVLCELVKVVFPRYCRYWEDDDKRTEWIVREGQFKVPFSFPDYTGEERTINLVGMRDGVFRYPKSGKLGIFETKNLSRISEDEIRNTLHADFQTLFYATATSIELGEYPSKVNYNVIRRPTNYRKKQETLKQYIEKVKKDIEKRPQFYFMRWDVSLSRKDIDSFVSRNLVPLFADFSQWWDSVKKNPMRGERNKSIYHRVNYSALSGKYGVSEFFPAIARDDTTSYRVREEVFPELEDSFLATH